MRRHLSRFSLWVPVFWGLFLALTPTCHPRTIYVSLANPDPGPGYSWETAYRFISTALAASASGDEIWVSEGTYYECPVLQPGILLYGGFSGTETSREERDWNLHPTVIDGSGRFTTGVTLAERAVLDGFVITGASGSSGGGVAGQNLSATISNCLIDGNDAFVGGGVYFKGCSDLNLIRCTLRENYAFDSGGGFYFDACSGVSIQDCTFVSNESGYTTGRGGGGFWQNTEGRLESCRIQKNRCTGAGGGLYFLTGAQVGLRNCLITDNLSRQSGGALYASLAERLEFRHCTLADNISGASKPAIDASLINLSNCIIQNPGDEFPASDSPSKVISFCLMEGGADPRHFIYDGDPLFCDPSNGDYRLQNGSPAIDRGVPIEAIGADIEENARPGLDGLVDLGAYESPDEYQPSPPEPVTAGRLFVRVDASGGGNGSSWDTALPTVGEAIQMAGRGDEIWIAEGVYREQILLRPSLSLYGGFAGTETSLEQRDPIEHETVIRSSSEEQYLVEAEDYCTIDGIVLDGEGKPSSSGVLCEWTSPKISNCRMMRMGNGAIHCLGGSPILYGLTVSDNSSPLMGAGLRCASKGFPRIENCLFARNRSDQNGGAISLDPGSRCEMIETTLESNAAQLSGGGLYVNQAPWLSMNQCLLEDNSATHSGGGIHAGGPGQSRFTESVLKNNRSSASGGGGYFSQGEQEFYRCRVEDNLAQSGGGLYLLKGAQNVASCRFERNSASVSGGAIYADQSPMRTVNCIFDKNEAQEGGALFCPKMALEAVHCTYADNYASTGSGVYLKYTSGSTDRRVFCNCIFRDNDEIFDQNTQVTWCCLPMDLEGEGNFSADPYFVHAASGDYRLLNGSPCIDQGTHSWKVLEDIEGVPRPGSDGRVDLGAHEMPADYASAPPQVVYVRCDAPPGGDGRSWERALSSMSAAVLQTAVTGEVWVAAGTYRESVLMRAERRIYGGFPASGSPSFVERSWTSHPTIIDVSGIALDGVTGARNAEVNGFIITGASSEGIYVSQEPFTLRNCSLSQNPVGLYGTKCRLLVENCIIDNSGGAGVKLIDAEAEIRGCTATENRSDAFYASGGSLLLDRCRLEGNGGSGVWVSKSTASISSCVLFRNLTGIRNEGGSVNAVNCLIGENSRSGVYMKGTKLDLAHCTLVNNSGPGAAGIYNQSGITTAVNSILWNRGVEVYQSADVRYSCVQNGVSGEGNIDAYPRFVNALMGDFRLLEGSPCIDRALVSDSPDTDILGRPRPDLDGLSDMGAYESPDAWQPAPPPPPQILYVRPDGPADADGRSWETAFASIQRALDVAAASDAIWVAQGRYPEVLALPPAVEIFGGFSGTEDSLEDRDPYGRPCIVNTASIDLPAVSGNQDAVFDGFTISGNPNIAVSIQNYSMTLQNCRILDNRIGLQAGNCDELILRNCEFSGNSMAPAQISLASIGNATLVNCLLANPKGAQSSAIELQQVNLDLNHCTLFGHPFGAIAGKGTAKIRNSILWNAGQEIALDSAAVEYSNIQGGWLGEGNISESPGFVSPGQNNFQLLDHSPCIDQATLSNSPAEDILGAPRPGGDGLADMGAFESPGEFEPGSNSDPLTIYVDANHPQPGDGLSWEGAFATLPMAVSIANASSEIWIASGTYEGFLRMEPSISLYGGFAGGETDRSQRDIAQNRAVIADPSPGSLYSKYFPLVSVADGNRFDGIEFRNTVAYPGTILAAQCRIEMTDCDLIGSNNECVKLENSTGTFVRCTVKENKQNAFNIRSSTVGFEDCLIERSNYGGFYLTQSVGTFQRCRVSECKSFPYNIQNSLFRLEDCYTGKFNKGGVNLVSASGALSHCRFEGNEGALALSNSLADVRSCTVEYFSGSAALCGGTSEMTLRDCLITNAIQSGGIQVKDQARACLVGTEISRQVSSAVYLSGSGSAIIQESTLAYNSGATHGAAICLTGSAEVSVSRSVITDNFAGNRGGAIYHQGKLAVFENCLLARNRAVNQGDILYVYYDPPMTRMTHCTLVNDSSSSGIAICLPGYRDSLMLEMSNCILWQETGEALHASEKEVAIDHSCIRYGHPGEGNIGDLPGFVDFAGGDYRLKNGSPCIDRGIPIPEIGADLSGAPRPGEDGLVDMGAYESPASYEPTGLQKNILHVRADAGDNGDGSSWDLAFDRISDALEQAIAGDHVWIAAGRYLEAIVIPSDVSLWGGFDGTEESLEERANLFHDTIIDASGLNRAVAVGMGDQRLDGLTFVHGNSTLGGGINYSNAGSARISNCIVRNNKADMGGGIYLKLVGHADLTNCLIADNYAKGKGGAIYCETGLSALNCTLAGNTAPSIGGIYNSSKSQNDPVKLVNCILWNENLEVNWIDTLKATHCNSRQRFFGEGQFTAIPLFVDPSGGDYRLRPNSPCIDRGSLDGAPSSDLDGRARPGEDGWVDLGTYESPDEYVAGKTYSPIYVKADASPGGDGSSWDGAFTTISDALDRAIAGEVIWVASGVYHETIRMKPQVSMFGGFRGNETDWDERARLFSDTIIDAADLKNTVVTAAHWTALDGFTIQNGSGSRGGGIYSRYACHLIQNCTIRNCKAEYGGGLYLFYSGVNIVNTAVIDNYAKYGGAQYMDQASSNYFQCTVAGNKRLNSYQGVFYGTYHSPKIYGSIVWNEGSYQFSTSYGYSYPTVRYSSVRGGYSGEGNKSDDPLFEDPEHGNYRLKAASPCINASTYFSGVPASMDMDLDGNCRAWPVGGVPDMGAYEYDSFPIDLPWGDLDFNNRKDFRDMFLFSRYWQEENNETSFRYNPVGGARVDSEDLLLLLPIWSAP